MKKVIWVVAEEEHGDYFCAFSEKEKAVEHVKTLAEELDWSFESGMHVKDEKMDGVVDFDWETIFLSFYNKDEDYFSFSISPMFLDEKLSF